MDFSARPTQTQEILKLICRTATGAKLLSEFMPRFHSCAIRIEPYPSELLEKLKAALGEGQPVGACFIQDENGSVIFIDMTSPIGVLAPFLAHEIVHSLDQTLYRPSEPGQSEREKQQKYLHAELKAFTTQHAVVSEMKEAFPEYAGFLKSHYPKAMILHDRLTELQIADLYGFDAA